MAISANDLNNRSFNFEMWKALSTSSMDSMLLSKSIRAQKILQKHGEGWYSHQGIVDCYQYRIPYGDQVFQILMGLLNENSKVVLDAGCGRGEIARRLVSQVDRIDAVDVSANMIATGKSLPNGDHPRLNWVQGKVESVKLNPPYDLIVAGLSLHWMDYQTVLPRFAQMLDSNGVLAIIVEGQFSRDVPWLDEMTGIINRYKTVQTLPQTKSQIETLEGLGLFVRQGEATTPPRKHQQSIQDYIKCIQTFGICSKSVGEEELASFANEMKRLLEAFTDNGMLTFEIKEKVVWGQPQKKVY